MLMQQLLNGLAMGSVYTLVALGLTLVYGILHIPNFAHGAIYMVGAYGTYTLSVLLGWNYWAAMLMSIIVVGLLSVLQERIVFHPLRHATPIHAKIAAIGVLLFLEACAQAIWGAEFRMLPSPYDKVVTWFGVSVTQQKLLIILAALVLMAALHVFLRHTTVGSTILAMAQNREGAYLVGINANRVSMLTFFIAGALATVAASLVAPINLVFPAMGHLVIMKAFVIVVLGGMGSIPGAIVGGYILGLAEAFGGTFISSDYKDIIAFLLLVIIFTFKPTGLFAKEVA
ncbi:MAG: ABC transporter permease [Bacillaceae bacterium G1]|nr:branched-chain amino acid ABC transporter permease [Bacillota bacterium]OJF16901.1 MAG: ABC transporter permease [Bacillaceae bacterium G1]